MEKPRCVCARAHQDVLQIDNQLNRPVYPIVLYRMQPKTEAAARARKESTVPALRAAAVIAKGGTDGTIPPAPMRLLSLAD